MDSAKVLCDKILSDAKKEAEDIIKEAENKAAQKREQAAKEAESTFNDIVKKAEEDAGHISKRILAGVNLEAKQLTLRGREQLISFIFDKAKERIEKMRGSEDYRYFLKNLALEGIPVLSAQNILLYVKKEDRGIITEDFLKDISAEIEEKQGLKVSMVLSETSIKETGVTLESSDGSVVFNNTVEERIKRFRDELRIIIVREVFGE